MISKEKGNPTVAEVFEKSVDIRSYAPDPVWVIPDTMIGLELEIEGCPKSVVGKSKYWQVTEDGSLRVVDGAQPYEVRFALPFCGKDLTNAMEDLKKGFKATAENPPVHSTRTSVHVHL